MLWDRLCWPLTGTISDSFPPGIKTLPDCCVKKTAFNPGWNGFKYTADVHVPSMLTTKPKYNASPFLTSHLRETENKSSVDAEMQQQTQTDSSDTCQKNKMHGEDGCETSQTRSWLSVLEVAHITRGSEGCTKMTLWDSKNIRQNITSLSAPKPLILTFSPVFLYWFRIHCIRLCCPCFADSCFSCFTIMYITFNYPAPLWESLHFNLFLLCTRGVF